MRFRVRRKGRAGHISIPEKPEKKAVPLKAADLDNPYGRYYGKARSREDLKRYFW